MLDHISLPHLPIVRIILNFLEENNIEVLLPMRMDLNPIEHVWDMMGRRIQFGKIANESPKTRSSIASNGGKYLKPQLDLASMCVSVCKKSFEDEAEILNFEV